MIYAHIAQSRAEVGVLQIRSACSARGIVLPTKPEPFTAKILACRPQNKRGVFKARMGIKFIENFETEVELEPSCKEDLDELLANPTFCKQVGAVLSILCMQWSASRAVTPATGPPDEFACSAKGRLVTSCDNCNAAQRLVPSAWLAYRSSTIPNRPSACLWQSMFACKPPPLLITSLNKGFLANCIQQSLHILEPNLFALSRLPMRQVKSTA